VVSRFPTQLNSSKMDNQPVPLAHSQRRLRYLLVLAAVLAPGWAGVLALTTSEAAPSLAARFGTSLLALGILGLSFVWGPASKHLERLALALAGYNLLFLAYEVHATSLSNAAAIGYIVATLGTAMVFESQRLLVSYLGCSVLLSLLIGGPDPHVPRLLFIAANICAIGMAVISFYDKNYLINQIKNRLKTEERHNINLRDMQLVSKIGGWSLTLESNAVWWSEQSYAIYEVASDTPMSIDSAMAMVAPEARYLVTSAFRDARLHGKSFEIEVPIDTALGKRKWVRLSCKAKMKDDNLTRLVGSIQDITSEKHLSNELIAREAHVRAVIDAIPGFVSWTDSDLRYLGVNAALAAACDLKPADFVGKQAGFLLHQGMDPVTEFMREIFSRDNTDSSREVTFSFSGNDERHFLLSAKKYHSGNRAVLIGLDITEQKRAEQELRQQKDLLVQILDSIPLGIYAKDATTDYRYLMWNKHMESLTGRTRLSLINQGDAAIYPPQESDKQRRIDSQVLSSRRQLDHLDEALLTLNGPLSTHWVRVPVFNHTGDPILLLGVVQDISEKKAREELIQLQQTQLHHAGKMSTLGELSGGVAHEINNPLTVIKGFAGRLVKLSESANPDLAEIKRYTERIVVMAGRIEKIVHGLKTFSRDGSKDPFARTSVQGIITDTLELCHQRFLANHVRLELPSATLDASIECRAVQISQVLLNMLNNAFDAVQSLSEKWVRLDLVDLGEAISFAVTDSGNGIPPAIAEKMLNPFFTTKGIGQGTGLGLSISLGLVQLHNGNLYYDSSVANTRFVFVIPKQHLASQAQQPLVNAA